MQLILETQEEIAEYIEYLASKKQSITPTYGESYIESYLRSTTESEVDRATDYESEIPQPEVETRDDLQDIFSYTAPTRRYHKWSTDDDNTLIACARSDFPSHRKLSYVVGRLAPPITVGAVKSRYNKLGYSVKELKDIPGEFIVCQPN